MAGWLAAAIQAVSTTMSSTASTTRRIAYLPGEHTDFIFTFHPDSFSLVRLAVLVVLLVMMVLMLRRRRIAKRDRLE